MNTGGLMFSSKNHLRRFMSEKIRRKGFTLIELLLVIGIIIVLASLVLVSVSKSRARGRDAKRIADLAQIQLALEMYKDSNQKYPVTGAGWINSNDTCTGVCTPVANWSALQGSSYLQSYLYPLPKDPLNDKVALDEAGAKYVYNYKATMTDYKIMAKLEDDTAKMTNTGGDGGVKDNRYEIFTKDAQSW